MKPNRHNVLIRLIEKAPTIILTVAVLIIALKVRSQDIPHMVDTVVGDEYWRTLSIEIALSVTAIIIVGLYLWRITRK
jgi:midasin (ATPase involved in ribosome maturation)